MKVKGSTFSFSRKGSTVKAFFYRRMVYKSIERASIKEYREVQVELRMSYSVEGYQLNLLIECIGSTQRDLSISRPIKISH